MSVRLSDRSLSELQEVLEKIERSFNVRFGTKLVGTRTYGELCTSVKNIAAFHFREDCTFQQGFYKFRYQICKGHKYQPDDIHLNSKVSEILSRMSYIEILRIQRFFGIQFYVSNFFGFGAVAGLCIAVVIGFFQSFPGAFIFILFWYILIKAINPKSLRYYTVREVVEDMVRNKYYRCRRIKGTANEKEVDRLLKELFSTELQIDRHSLSDDARLPVK